MLKPELETLRPQSRYPLPASASQVVRALAPFVTAERMQKIERVIARRLNSLVVVMEDISDPHNAAAVLRSAEAFGVLEVHVVENKQRFVAAKSVTQGSHRWLDIRQHSDVEECIAELHRRNFKVYVADGAAASAQAPEELCAQAQVAVIFGNEHDGVSDRARRVCDGVMAIPMQGFVESLNLSVAAAVTMYAACRGRHGDLSPESAQELRAWYMMASVDRAEQIIEEQLTRSMPAVETTQHGAE